ncbi:MAG: hypothetical protein CM15mP49_35400 [Actinomycetota bacterium]|nr:MAG: hypothetical protein CM15mP49_35400 [Actinomycetota bacterium]
MGVCLVLFVILLAGMMCVLVLTRDPYSLPKEVGGKAQLGKTNFPVRGYCVTGFGVSAIISDAVRKLVEEVAAEIIAIAGLQQVDVPVSLPPLIGSGLSLIRLACIRSWGRGGLLVRGYDEVYGVWCSHGYRALQP